MLRGPAITGNSRAAAGPQRTQTIRAETSASRRVAPAAVPVGDLLRVENLSVGFEDRHHAIREVVRGVSFTLAPGHCLAIVGESGSVPEIPQVGRFAGYTGGEASAAYATITQSWIVPVSAGTHTFTLHLSINPFVSVNLHRPVRLGAPPRSTRSSCPKAPAARDGARGHEPGPASSSDWIRSAAAGSMPSLRRPRRSRRSASRRARGRTGRRGRAARRPRPNGCG